MVKDEQVIGRGSWVIAESREHRAKSIEVAAGFSLRSQ